MAGTIEVKCAKCDALLPAETPTSAAAQPRCSVCGSTERKISASISDEIIIRDSWKGKVIDGALPSKQKIRREFFNGSEKRKSHGDYVYKVRYIDRDANRYHELVRKESGEIIRDVDEPLTDHVGHGSVKLKPKKSDEDTGQST
jgi:hypothetical protein